MCIPSHQLTRNGVTGPKLAGAGVVAAGAELASRTGSTAADAVPSCRALAPAVLVTARGVIGTVTCQLAAASVLPGGTLGATVFADVTWWDG